MLLYVRLVIIGLLISSNAIDNATNVLHSWVFWASIISLTVMVMGFVIMIAGFLRSLLVPVISGALVAIGIGAYNYSIRLYNTSIPLLVMFIVSLATLIYFSLFYLFRHFAIKNCRSFMYFEKNKQIYGADLSYKDFLPLESYSKLLIVTIEVSSQVSLNVVEKFIDRFQFFMRNHSIAFVATIIDLYNNDILLYTYIKDKKR